MERKGIKAQVLQVIDACGVLVSFFLSLILWNCYGNEWIQLLGERFGVGVTVVSIWDIATVLYVAVPCVPIVLKMLGYYRRYGRQGRRRALWRSFQATITALLFFTILAVFLKLTPHRPTLIGGFVFATFVIWFRELWMLRRYAKKASLGVGQMRILIAGREDSVINQWWDGLGDEIKINYKRVGVYYLAVHDLQNLRDILTETAAERVIFLAEGIAFEKVAYAMEECEIQGVEVWLAADFVRSRICQPTFDMLGGTPMLVLRSTPSLSWSLIIKEVMDRVGALALLIGSMPFWVLAVIGIKLQSPGSIFYKQQRAGKYGHPFYIWKFRTMVVDADSQLEELKTEAGNEMTGPVFKLENDPRIFPFGRFMRKFSIDELPQLINVLKGEMSLVGPRPMAMYELPDIEKSEHRRKLSVKPGITCIWQVEGRNSITDFNDWVQMDLEYIDNWSVWLDCKLLLKTIPAVLLSRGAS